MQLEASKQISTRSGKRTGRHLQHTHTVRSRLSTDLPREASVELPLQREVVFGINPGQAPEETTKQSGTALTKQRNRTAGVG